jgi:hypothetical protein
VRLGEHRLLFRPRDSFDQRLLQSHLAISPQPVRLRWIHDVFGNCVSLFDFDTCSTYLDIESLIRLDHTPERAPDFEIDENAKLHPFDYDPDQLPDLQACIDDNAMIRMTAYKNGFSVLWNLGGSSPQAVF